VAIIYPPPGPGIHRSRKYAAGGGCAGDAVEGSGYADSAVRLEFSDQAADIRLQPEVVPVAAARASGGTGRGGIGEQFALILSSKGLTKKTCCRSRPARAKLFDNKNLRSNVLGPTTAGPRDDSRPICPDSASR